MTSPLRIFIGIVFGLIFQIMLLNNVQLLGYMTPYYYPILILTLPAVMNQHGVLILGFISGFVVDIFEHTGALHASSSLVLAYMRPVLLRLVSTQSGRELPAVSLFVLGFRDFFLYTLIGIFLHHFILFFIDALRLTNIDVVLLRSTYTTLLSMVVILLVHGLLSPVKKSP